MAAINGIFVFGVIGLALGAIYFSMQMKLDRKNHAVLLEIARIKAGGASKTWRPRPARSPRN